MPGNYSIMLDVDDSGYHLILINANGFSHATHGALATVMDEIANFTEIEETKAQVR